MSPARPTKRKPGRPPSADGPRTNRVQVLLSDPEKARVEKAAGIGSLSDYLRTAGLEKAARFDSKGFRK